jgi:hypothetical protein
MPGNAPCLDSTQALRSRHVSFASKLLGAPGSVSARRASDLGFVVQPSNPANFVVNRHKPRVQTPIVSRYLAPAPVHDFVLLFLPPCGPHLTPLPPSPSSQAYFSLHSSKAPQGIDLSCPLFTCTNANQVATCTCNTRPRVSPHHVVNHSSQPGSTNHQSLDAPVLSCSRTFARQRTLPDDPHVDANTPRWIPK